MGNEQKCREASTRALHALIERVLSDGNDLVDTFTPIGWTHAQAIGIDLRVKFHGVPPEEWQPPKARLQSRGPISNTKNIKEYKMKTRLFMLLLLSLAGCNANWNSIYRTHDFQLPQVSKERQQSVFIDIHQRAIISGNDTICAEPSPDAMQAYAAQLAASGTLSDRAKAELAAAVQTSAAYIGVRSKNIQLFRDEFYRLCEARMNDTLDDAQYNFFLARLQRYSVALAAVEELNQGPIGPAAYLASSGSASVAGLAAQKQELTSVQSNLVEAKKLAIDSPSDAATAKVTELTEKEATLKKNIDENKNNSVSGATTGKIGTPISGTSQITADATQKIIIAALTTNDLPYMCLERLNEYAKRNMSLNESDSWSQLPDGRIVSRGGRPLNEADRVIVSYCKSILQAAGSKAEL